MPKDYVVKIGKGFVVDSRLDTEAHVTLCIVDPNDLGDTELETRTLSYAKKLAAQFGGEVFEYNVKAELKEVQ